MIEGERGLTMVENIVVLRSGALLDGDTVTTMLLSATIAQALRAGETPRKVMLDLWDSLPTDDEWTEVICPKVEQAIDELEARGL